MDVMPANIVQTNLTPQSSAAQMPQGPVVFGAQGDFASYFQQASGAALDADALTDVVDPSFVDPQSLLNIVDPDVESDSDSEDPTASMTPEELAAFQAMLNLGIQEPLPVAENHEDMEAMANLLQPTEVSGDAQEGMTLDPSEWDLQDLPTIENLPDDLSVLSEMENDLALLGRQLQAESGEPPQLTLPEGMESFREILSQYCANEQVGDSAHNNSINEETYPHLFSETDAVNASLVDANEGSSQESSAQTVAESVNPANALMARVLELMKNVQAALQSGPRAANPESSQEVSLLNAKTSLSSEEELAELEIPRPSISEETIEEPQAKSEETAKQIAGAEEALTVKNQGTANESVVLTKDNGRVVFEQPVSASSGSNMAERIEHQQAVRQVAQRVHWMVQNGESRAVMRLDPPELGHVELEIHSKQGELKVHMTVESESVKQTLESSIGNLRTAMEQSQVKLEKLEVQVDLGHPEGQAAQGDAQSGHRRSHKGGRGTLIAETIADTSVSDTGRRFGYNTMELIA